MFIYKRPIAAVLASLLAAGVFVAANLMFSVGG
jgi:hypothetical protein